MNAELAALPLGLLDGGRRALLAAALRVPGLGAVVARRDSRIALLATVGVVVAAGLTVAAPMVLFVLGPVLLGVPHVAGDVRYLVLRRDLPRRWKAAVGFGCATLFAVRVLSELHPRPFLPRAEFALATAWALLAAIAGAAGAPRAVEAKARARRLGVTLLVVVVLAALGAAAMRAPRTATLVFVHAHNLVGVAVWLAVFRGAAERGAGRLRTALVPVAAIAVTTAALLFAPAMLGFTPRLRTEQAFGLHLLTITEWLAPGLPFYVAVGLSYSYVFLQSVHYSVWLSWIPQEDVRAQGTLTFRMTWRALVRDFGPAGLLALCAAAAAVGVGALYNVHRARALYLSLAMFHGYLEIAMLAYFVARAGVRRSP